MSTSLGDQLVVILWVRVAPPCVQGLQDTTPCLSDAQPGCGNRLHSYALLQSWAMFTPRLVLYNHGLCPVSLGPTFVVVFTKSQSCRLCYNRTCVFGSAMTRSHSILKKTWFLSPKPILCPCSDCVLLPPSTCKQNGRMSLWTKKTLEGMGDCSHFHVTATSWGSQASC